MMAYPCLDKISTILEGKHPVTSPHSRRPVIAKLFELQRWMRLFTLEQCEILSCKLLQRLRQGIKTIPELCGCPMHSQTLKLSCRLGFHGFPLQEIKLSRSGILHNLPVPSLPVHGFNPFPEFDELLLWQRGYFGLDMF